MTDLAYKQGATTLLNRLGFKTATAPEMGELQVSPAFTPATGDSGQTMGRTNDDPRAQTTTAFNEYARQYALEPASTSLFSVGSNQSANTKVAAVATYADLLKRDDLPIEPDSRVKPMGGVYERGKRIAYDPDNPNLLNIIAHELGHSDVDKTTLGRAIQHPLARVPHLFGPSIAAVTAMRDRAHGKAKGTAYGALASVPTLTSEALAHRAAYKRLKDLGASDAQLGEYVKDAIPAFASYLAVPAMTLPISILAHRAKFGAYKLDGRTTFRDFDISIETDKGNYRYWYDKAAKKHGRTKMKYPYGYIRMTQGMDGDHVDCFVGPNENAPNVYVITTNKAPDFKEIDEQKCMLGFDSAEEAKAAFLAHYDKPDFFRSMKAFQYEAFKEKVFATKDVGNKIATDMYPSDGSLIENATGSADDQVPGDFLGLPYRSRLRGHQHIIGNGVSPDDRIDRMFRFHDEDMNMRAIENDTGATLSEPSI